MPISRHSRPANLGSACFPGGGGLFRRSCTAAAVREGWRLRWPVAGTPRRLSTKLLRRLLPVTLDEDGFLSRGADFGPGGALLGPGIVRPAAPGSRLSFACLPADDGLSEEEEESIDGKGGGRVDGWPLLSWLWGGGWRTGVVWFEGDVMPLIRADWSMREAGRSLSSPGEEGEKKRERKKNDQYKASIEVVVIDDEMKKSTTLEEVVMVEGLAVVDVVGHLR